MSRNSALMFICVMAVSLICVGCSVVKGGDPDYVSTVYIVDNILIKDPCIVGVDSVLFVVPNRSKIHSKSDLPDFSNEFVSKWWPDFYQVWYPFLYYYTPRDFFEMRYLAHPARYWSALSEVYDGSLWTPNYYRKSFLDNLKEVWRDGDVVLYDFVKQPRSFILVLQQDVEIECSGFEASTINGTRSYKPYICPVQKRYRVKI